MKGDIEAWLAQRVAPVVGPDYRLQPAVLNIRRCAPAYGATAVFILLLVAVTAAYIGSLQRANHAQATAAALSTVSSGDRFIAAGLYFEGQSHYRDAITALGRIGEDTLIPEAALWEAEVKSPSPAMTYNTNGADLACIAISADGKHLAAGGSHGRIYLWDVKSGVLVNSFAASEQAIHELKFCGDNKSLVSSSGNKKYDGSGNSSLDIWDTATGRLSRHLFSNEQKLCDFDVSRDGIHLVTDVDSEGDLAVWNLITGKRLCWGTERRFRIVPTFANSIRFASDGIHIGMTFDHRFGDRIDQVLGGWEIWSFSGSNLSLLASTGSAPQFAFADCLFVDSVEISRQISQSSVPSLLLKTSSYGENADQVIPVDTRAWDDKAKLTRLNKTAWWESVVAVDSSQSTVAFGRDNGQISLYRGGGIWNPDVHLFSSLNTAVDPYQELARVLGVKPVMPQPSSTIPSSTSSPQLDGISSKPPLFKLPTTRPASPTRWTLSMEIAKSWGIGQGSRPKSICCLPDGTGIISLGTEGSLKLWRIPTHGNDVGQDPPAELKRFFKTESSGSGIASGPVAMNANPQCTPDALLLCFNENRIMLDVSTGHWLKLRDGVPIPKSRDLDNGNHLFEGILGGAPPSSPFFVDAKRAVRLIPGTHVFVRQDDSNPNVNDFLRGDLIFAGPSGVRNYAKMRELIDIKAKIAGAQSNLRNDPDNANANRILGDWYACRGFDDWAIEFLERAQKRDSSTPSLTLARCLWNQGRFTEAGREFQRAIDRQEAPEYYLQLCLHEVKREEAEKAATRPAVGSP